MPQKKNTTYLDSVFTDWKKISTPRIWEVAAMMRGYDPRDMTDATNAQGDGLDLSFEIRMLTSAVATGTLAAVPPATTADAQTEIAAASLVPWLRMNGLAKLADSLSPTPIPATGAIRWTPEFIAVVKDFRDMHGTKAAAEKFGVSEARIREKLPGGGAAAKANDPFNLTGKTP